MDIVAKEATKFNTDSAMIHYNYANALGKTERFAESEQHFLQAIKLDPNSASYYSNLGMVLI